MTGSSLVRIDSDWDNAGILLQTPGGTGGWDGIRFTTEAVEECDFLVVCNNRKREAITTLCAPEHVWAMMQEPYIAGLYDWMIEGHEAYSRVFTHMVPNNHPRYIAAPPATPWLVGLSYDELKAASIPSKTQGTSWVTSSLSLLPYHRLRNALRKALGRQRPPLVDVFGRGIRPIARKWEALAPYRYSLAIENAAGPHLWTEKVADCFLSWTVPLYAGCTNLEEYFPKDSFIRIDPADPDSVIARIRQLALREEWEQRLAAVEIARRRVLEQYQIFPFLAGMIRSVGGIVPPKEEIRIPPYREMRRRHQLRYLSLLARTGDFRQFGDTVASTLKYLRWFGR